MKKYILMLTLAASCSAFAGSWSAGGGIATNTTGDAVLAWLTNNFYAIDNFVDGSDPSDLHVDGAKVKSASIPLGALAADSVNGSKIVDDSIGTADYAPGSVDYAALAVDSVHSTRIIDGTIAAVDLGTNSVTAGKIADDSVGTSELTTNSVTAAKIADGAVGTSEIATNSVTAAKIADGAVGTSELATNSVTTAKIPDGTIIAADIADGNVTSQKLASAVWDTIDTMAAAGDYSFYVMPNIMEQSGVPFNIHVKTKLGGAYTTGFFLYRMWVSDFGSYAPTTNTFDSCEVTTGTELTSVSGTEFYEAMTASSGELIFTVTETGERENMCVNVVLLGTRSSRTFSIVVP